MSACDAVDVVQRQVDAYNRRDVAAFVAIYAEDAALYDHPGKLWMQGREALTRAYGAMFSRAPTGYVVIRNRIAIGSTVTDHEIGYREKGGKPEVEIAALYTVKDCRIARVDFFPAPEPAK